VKKVLLAANISNTFQELLLQKSYALENWQGGVISKEVVGIITSNKLRLTQEVLQPCKNLKWIARLGSGIEIIDTDYCKANNIAFASSPAGIANAVAEHCVAMLISLQKNIQSSAFEIKDKEWIREPNRGWELEGKTVGILGYGHTGKSFARKLSVFGAKVIAYDKYKKNLSNEYAQEVSLSELQEMADVISFHVPLNKETTHYYNEAFIAACKKHILMNTARGELVDSQALLKALEQNKVIGAALDVIENEKDLVNKESTTWNVLDLLLEYPVIITPHIAGYSYNAIEKMSAELIEKLKAFL